MVDAEVEEGPRGKRRRRQARRRTVKDLFSGVGRLNDCDSKLGKTTFVAETDRQIGRGPKARLGKKKRAYLFQSPLEGNVREQGCGSTLSISFVRLDCGNP